MTISISLKEMLETGAHFGHQTHRWNPKMRPYIYGVKGGTHILNLQKTVVLFKKALEAVVEYVSKGGDVLFVGTKRQARDVIAEQAARCRMHYVNNRWMGGTLTNFQTIKSSIDKLIQFEQGLEKGEYAGLTKKERLGIERKIIKLSASLGGIRALHGMPSLLVIVDPKAERIAVNEAKVLDIPIAAMTDSNCDPDSIDYVIPANDDALRSVRYFMEKVADACLLGLQLREQKVRTVAEEDKVKGEQRKEAATKERRVHQVKAGKGETPKAYVRGAQEATEEEASPAAGTYSASGETEVPVVEETKE